MQKIIQNCGFFFKIPEFLKNIQFIQVNIHSPPSYEDSNFFLTFCQFLANFERLVLGCMDSYDSDQRLILQGFSRSTRLAFLCTAPISNLQSFAPLIFAIFVVILQNLVEFSVKSVIFRRDFHRILPELRQIAKDYQICL